MSGAQRTGHLEPPVSDRVQWWIGRPVPRAFGAWAKERIHSKWFPLRRAGGGAVIAAIWALIALADDGSLHYRLETAPLPILAGLVLGFAFQGWERRRELRRYEEGG